MRDILYIGSYIESALVGAELASKSSLIDLVDSLVDEH